MVGGMERLGQPDHRAPLAQPALYSLAFTLFGALLVLPWAIYTDFVREHQYGLSNQSFMQWLKDWGIMLGVGLVTNAIFFAIIYAVIRNSPKRWWLWGAGAFAVLTVILIMVAPIFIEPLLNKYTPMAAGPVRSEILRIAHEQESRRTMSMWSTRQSRPSGSRPMSPASARRSASRSTITC
jgi:STE24 endopeptidase